MYVLNIGENQRIMSAWNVIPGADYGDRPIVDEMPDGNLPDYRYVDGEYIYDPLPVTEEETKLTQEERITALEEALTAIEEGIASV